MQETPLRLTRRGRAAITIATAAATIALGLLLAHWTAPLCWYGPCSIPASQR